MNNKKIVWLFGGLLLLASLYMLVGSRQSNRDTIVFGGYDGSLVRTDMVETEEVVEDVINEDALKGWPDIDITLMQYAMVNDKNLLSSAFIPEDSRRIGKTNMMFAGAGLPYLNAMLADLEGHGFKYYIGGAYRSYSFQTILFNGKASQIAEGMGVYDYMDPKYQDAADEARTITMFPGASEHQTGLALDLFDKNYSYLKYENMNQEFFAYLDEICADYGFIKRYPTKKLLLTGWDEPWHYRYVGIEAAKFIMENGLCYEEFYAHYVPGFTY